MLLDHSSLESLMADLSQHRNGPFCWFETATGSISQSWRPTDARIVPGTPDTLHLQAETRGGSLHVFDFWLETRGGWLWSPLHNCSLRVRSGGFPSTVDDSLCRRLDDNLRSVFG